MNVSNLRATLAGIETIAIVGLSDKAHRASHEVALFLTRRGYRCVGVNPALAGRLVAGLPVVATLGDLPHPVDMVDIFRTSDQAGAVVDEALAISPRPRVIWMQLGVVDHAAAARAEAAGMTVVMDACPKMVLADQ